MLVILCLRGRSDCPCAIKSHLARGTFLPGERGNGQDHLADFPWSGGASKRVLAGAGTWHRVSTSGLAGPAGHPYRDRNHIWGSRDTDPQAPGGACCRHRGWAQCRVFPDSMPPDNPLRRRSRRLPVGEFTQGGHARMGADPST